MSERIVCEHFEMSESVKVIVLDHIEEIEERFTKEVDVSVYLIREGSGTFRAEFKVHAFRRDIVGKDQDEDIYAAMTRAKKHVIRQMSDIKDQKVTDRRR